MKSVKNYNEENHYKGECWRQESGANNMLSKHNEASIVLDFNNNIDVIGKSLSKITDIDLSNITAIDLGCGNASYLSYYIKCTGADLPFIISNYSKILNPGMDFIECDVMESDLSFLKEFDLVLISGLLTVMKEPLIILNKVLSNSSNYVLINRNQLTKQPTTTSKNWAYCGWTYETQINIDDFNYLLEKNGFDIICKEELIIGSGIIDSYCHLVKRSYVEKNNRLLSKKGIYKFNGQNN